VNDSVLHAFACMGTVVSLQVIGHGDTAPQRRERELAMARAELWFRQVEKSCNRFDATSEVRRLARHTGVPQRASELLIQAVQFALAVAEQSDGAFDPTVGQRMEAHGFDRAYQTGQRCGSALAADERTSFRDVEVDAARGTITLGRPLLLDLGAVVKGLAIDLAARELAPLVHFQVNAGGDVYVGGFNGAGETWRVGIRHPRATDQLIATLAVRDCAVCTSGDYERIGEISGQHHIMNARNGAASDSLASATVVAPSAMVADALATAAFALGPTAGLALVERHALGALLVTPALERFSTKGLPVV
jgi:thiamine biosynthesis lipoprotein